MASLIADGTPDINGWLVALAAVCAIVFLVLRTWNEAMKLKPPRVEADSQPATKGELKNLDSKFSAALVETRRELMDALTKHNDLDMRALSNLENRLIHQESDSRSRLEDMRVKVETSQAALSGEIARAVKDELAPLTEQVNEMREALVELGADVRHLVSERGGTTRKGRGEG